MNRKNAFTLIELLVVIAIIGILATVSVIALQNARAKSRDAKRAGDVKQIQTALELFFNDKNRYPTNDEFNSGSVFSTSTAGTSTYLQIIPTAPTPADGTCTTDQNTMTYIQNENGNSYTISFCLGNTTGSLTPGQKCLTPGGIIDASCGDHPCLGLTQLTYSNSDYTCTTGDTCIYNLVEAGGRCWMKENLNVGSIVLGATSQTDNDLFEKYCYNDHETNPDPATTTCANGENCGGCDTDGGLYQWDEAMQYSVTEGAQGICPDGWHLPTDSDWHSLELAYTVPPDESSCPAIRSGYSCNGASVSLKTGGISGFNILTTGDRYLYGLSYDRGTVAWFWTSLVNAADSAWNRYFYFGGPMDDMVARADSALKVYGLSVRCIKN
jgi:uncharacterized protein (TIGR02145 family)/prepilin-type N-terminal cleavage/methylation domain-containing protein